MKKRFNRLVKSWDTPWLINRVPSNVHPCPSGNCAAGQTVKYFHEVTERKKSNETDVPDREAEHPFFRWKEDFGQPSGEHQESSLSL